MTTYQNSSDNYLDTSTRSPRSLRTQPQLRRQASRPFDAYGTMPTGPMYPTEDTMSRFESGRNVFQPPMQATQLNGHHFPYELGGAQTWNTTTNPLQPLGGHNTGMMPPIGSFGATGRLKPSRGRNGLPSVSSTSVASIIRLDFDYFVDMVRSKSSDVTVVLWHGYWSPWRPYTAA